MTRDTTRRALLKKAAVAPAGLLATAAQDGSDGHRVNRRMAFQDPESLSSDYVRRIVLLTDRHQERPSDAEVPSCSFDDWPPDRPGLWEGLVIEWEDSGGFSGFLTQDPKVRAQKMVELRIVVDEREDPVELGTPFIVENTVECAGDHVGVTASQVPGLRIKTPPSVDTDG